MRKSWLKVISLALIFILVIPMFYDAFNARLVFAAEGIKGDLPLEKINRDHYFRMVELCWPKYIQKLIRWLANWAIDKIGQGILSAIPIVGGLLADFWDNIEVFRDKVDLPIYPRCNCKNDDNTQDSAWLPLNWRFAQKSISKDVGKRYKELFPKMESNQHPMFPSADVSSYSNSGNEIDDGTNRYYDLRLSQYGPVVLLKGSGTFDSIYPNYSGFTSVIDEQKRISDWWRKVQLGYMIIINWAQGKPFSTSELAWRESLLKDMYSIDSTKAQTAALQYLGVEAKGLSTQAESSHFTSFSLFETGITPLQNKKSLRQAFHKNVDLMAHNAATKQAAVRKVKLGFN